MSPKHWLLTLPLLRVAPLLTRLVLLRKHSIPTRRIIRRPPRRRSLSNRKDARRSFVSRPLSARHAGCPTQNASRSQSNSILVDTLTSYLRDIILPPIHSTRYAAPTHSQSTRMNGAPSITVSALSRDTYSVRGGPLIPATTRGFDFPFVELLVLRLRLLFAHSTQGSLSESRGGSFGSTNHLSDHGLPTMIRCSDSPTVSGRQGAQSGQRCLTGPPGCPSGCLACEPAARNWPGCAASSTSVPPTCGRSRLSPLRSRDAASAADSLVVTRHPAAPPCVRLRPAANASWDCLASRSLPIVAFLPKSARADSVPGN